MKLRIAVICAALSLLLSLFAVSCGGGGGGGGTPADNGLVWDQGSWDEKNWQ
jgi:hypothetical protein